MKRFLALTIAGAVLLAIPASHLAFGKAHVPVLKAQICHNGKKGKFVPVHKLEKYKLRGHCELPACDFANIFPHNADCRGLVDEDGDGRCDLPNDRIDAAGSPGCPVDASKY